MRLFLLASVACSLAMPVNGEVGESCSQFFANLGRDSPGSCVELSFFGFDGSEVGGFSIARSGTSPVTIDLFDEIVTLPDFFDPLEPVFASVELTSAGTSGIPGFRIKHTGRTSMFPLATAPPSESITSRFIAASSRNRTIFRAHHPDPGSQEIEIEVKLEQDFELVDPIASGLGSDAGSSFRIETAVIETGEVIHELLGDAKFDSGAGPAPDLGDAFRPGYSDYTNTLSPGPGRISCAFERTVSITIPEGLDISLDTLVSKSIFSNGFNPGNTSPWIAGSGDPFTITVSSGSPEVTLDLRAGPAGPLLVPVLNMERLPGNKIRLTWNGVDTQDYTVLFTPDLALPYDQWEERDAVSGTAGVITRDFPTSGPQGFFAVRTSIP